MSVEVSAKGAEANAANHPLFNAPSAFLVPLDPEEVIKADFNGDGFPDLASVTSGFGFSGQEAVNIQLNHGDGTFAPAITYPMRPWPTFVAAGDFNGDGKPDLVVTGDEYEEYVGVLLGNGDGTFQPPIYLPTVNENHGGPVAVSDFNGDGKLDLVVADRLSTDVSVSLGNGDGTFAAAVSYTVGTGPNSITVADVDGDRKLDLLVTNGGSNNVSLLRGQGNGQFLAQVVFTAGDGPSSLVVADFNEDGKRDLAVADSGSGGVSVLLGLGDGVFGPPAFYSAQGGTSAVAIGDFNRDGKLDLAAVNSLDAGSVSILLGNGDATFQSASNFPMSGTPLSLVVGDFNQDGFEDVASARYGGSSIGVLFGDGEGRLQQSKLQFGGGRFPVSVAAADFNGDGIPDLAVAEFGGGQSSPGVAILRNDGLGNFTPFAKFSSGNSPSFLGVADLNGDGILDVFTTDRAKCCEPNTLGVNLGSGQGLFQTPTLYPVCVKPHAAVSGDLNGDGKMDLAVACQHGSAFSILYGNGDGTFQPNIEITIPQPLPTPLPAPAIALGDLNHDGKLDVVVGGSTFLTIMLNQGNGNFGPGEQHAVSGATTAIAVADFDGDGSLDIAAAEINEIPATGVTGAVCIFLNNGDGTFRHAVGYGQGTPNQIVVGDWNGDGILDLAYSDASSDAVEILLGKGDGSFLQALTPMVGPSPEWIATEDFNRDGKPDLVTVNAGNNSLTVLRNISK